MSGTFVDHDRDGVDLTPLPGGARLVRRPVRGRIPGVLEWLLAVPHHGREIAISDAGWLVYAHSVNTWVRHPSATSIYRALRLHAPPTDLENWASDRGIEPDDVAWYRERRRSIGAPSTLDPDDLRRAISVLSRELADKEAETPKPRPFDLRVNGLSAFDMTPDQLADLSVAIDWHLGGSERRAELGRVIAPAVARVARLKNRRRPESGTSGSGGAP